MRLLYSCQKVLEETSIRVRCKSPVKAKETHSWQEICLALMETDDNIYHFFLLKKEL